MVDIGRSYTAWSLFTPHMCLIHTEINTYCYIKESTGIPCTLCTCTKRRSTFTHAQFDIILCHALIYKQTRGMACGRSPTAVVLLSLYPPPPHTYSTCKVSTTWRRRVCMCDCVCCLLILTGRGSFDNIYSHSCELL